MKFKRLRFLLLLILLVFIVLQIFHRSSSLIGRIFGTSNIIVIDPGHGGYDPGTIGINGSYEKDINLDISKKLYERLKSMDYKVLLTRNVDEYVDNRDRARFANRKRARVFISIHCNSIEDNSNTNGAQVLYFPNRESNANETLAQMILDQLLISTGANNKGIVEREDLIVLNQTKMPAIIVECGFLSNGNEANLLTEDEYQNKIVDGIVEGLRCYIK
ncbi:N-acetylmuramoyl-L-alanine amidase CwlD [Keratinibaculum paraultunense]|uniref:N-acetylmuramoyl-L-alanine amidase CwlD n=1 Tax=Keratinibaculum paraultunense TaxID=1278232 RepID=A0A4V6NZ60_9FIRM|nr:N-acetylmuramoyl-L-alanine amidase [Keratinibaculum paraultunense]QQY78891.1 N-acetylmuramoyl-L-alanine amidase [Keratinibaculum paraultunense]TCS90503.1 N-acetylmuramoyl-L-alanine amidase CwlD [Keratinibaculum paraultunense]